MKGHNGEDSEEKPDRSHGERMFQKGRSSLWSHVLTKAQKDTWTANYPPGLFSQKKTVSDPEKGSIAEWWGGKIGLWQTEGWVLDQEIKFFSSNSSKNFSFKDRRE